MKKMWNVYWFISSFIPLWIVIILLDIKNIIYKEDNLKVEYYSIPIITLFSLLSIIKIIYKLKKKEKHTFEKYTINKVSKNKDFSINGLVTFSIALLAFDCTTWYGIIGLLIIFFTLMILSIKNYYLMPNIILELFNYSFYECTLLNKNGREIEKIVITNKDVDLHRTIYLKDINNNYMYENNYKLE